MRHVKVHCVRIPRPCGCSTPICAIYTGNPHDRISIDSHSRMVNQNCGGPKTGRTMVHRWLTIADWLRKYTHNRNRRQYTEYLRVQCLKLKEENPRIPETYLI